MKGRGDTLPPVRVSDAEREKALRLIRDAAARGQLSHETFLGRVDAVFRSRSRDELADVVLDLPGRHRLADAAIRSTAATSRFTMRVRDAWRRPRLDRMVLPTDTARVYLLGRASHSDLVLAHPTVSWVHARLSHRAGTWVIEDVGSTNGTRVNGWAVQRPQPIRPGDRVTFGLLSLRIA